MAEFRALPLHALPGLVGYFEPSQELPAKVIERSPAVLVMTDLRHQLAVTIEANVSIDYALQRMKTVGVRLLFVINSETDVIGLITATDILGEKPLQFHQDLHLRYEEIMVRDIMTPYDRLEVLYMEEVMRATVGDIVATLRYDGRRHALVLDNDMQTGRPAIRGIFSISQIAKQLGQVLETPFVASNFAEVEMVLNS